MIYKARKGIVLTTVCGEYILVAAKKARENCPYITQVNETIAVCWPKLEQGCTPDQLVSCLQEVYEIEDLSLVKTDVDDLLRKFLEKGYIILIDEEMQHEKSV